MGGSLLTPGLDNDDDGGKEGETDTDGSSKLTIKKNISGDSQIFLPQLNPQNQLRHPTTADTLFLWSVKSTSFSSPFPLPLALGLTYCRNQGSLMTIPWGLPLVVPKKATQGS